MKICSKCGRRLSVADWEALPLLGHQVMPPYEPENDPGEVLEMRNCNCGSTLTVLEPFTAAELEDEVEEYMRRVPGISLKNARQLVIARLKSRSR